MCFGLILFSLYPPKRYRKIQNSRFYTSLNHISGASAKKLSKNPHFKEFSDFFADFIHIQPTTHFHSISTTYLRHILDFFHEIICIHPKSAPMIIYYPQHSRHTCKLFTTISETSPHLIYFHSDTTN